jgi:RNA polymerase sigma-70 factor (ECF subfamily)
MVASSNSTIGGTSNQAPMHSIDINPNDGMDAMPESHTQRAWVEHHQALSRFIARRLPRNTDVDDVLQTLFLNFHRHFGNGESPAAPRAWLYQAARHAIVDRYRAATRQHEEPVGDFETLAALAVAQHAVPPAEATGASIAGCVQPLLTHLSATDRHALALTDLGGATQHEAAVRSGISVPGMKARVQRARRRFRAVLDACCELTFDARGQVLSAEPRSGRPCPCETNSSSCTPARPAR